MNIKTFAACVIVSATVTALAGQQSVMDTILADTTLTGTSYSFCFADASTGEILFGYDADRNLASASVMKLYPTSSALLLLGPGYRYTTALFLSGKFNKRRGLLEGDVIIKGGGDPALGSEYFPEHYGDVTGQWVAALMASGVKLVK